MCPTEGSNSRPLGPDLSVLPLCYDHEFNHSMILIIKNTTLLPCWRRSRVSPQRCLPCLCPYRVCLPYLYPSSADKFRTGGECRGGVGGGVKISLCLPVSPPQSLSSPPSLSTALSVSASLPLCLTLCLRLPLSTPHSLSLPPSLSASAHRKAGE